MILVTQQSGTKPNLVAKIWPSNLVTNGAWLPKLVANVSFKFQHLVNTGLAVGSLASWLPIMVSHTCWGCKFEWFISRRLKMAPSDCTVIAFNTLCSVEFYIQWCVALHQTHWGSYFEKLIFLALEVNFLKKLPQLVALQIFQSLYISHGELLKHNILLHYY